MTTPFTYQFGYSWPIAWGHLVPLFLSCVLVATGLRLGWRRWLVWAFVLLGLWAVAGLVIAAVAVKEGREAWRGEGCCGPVGAAHGHEPGHDDADRCSPSGEGRTRPPS